MLWKSWKAEVKILEIYNGCYCCYCGVTNSSKIVKSLTKQKTSIKRMRLSKVL